MHSLITMSILALLTVIHAQGEDLDSLQAEENLR